MLVSNGAYVSILDINPPKDTDKLSSERIRFFKVDITDPKSVSEAVESTISWTKETKMTLRGVINAAGIGSIGRVLDTSKTPLNLDLFKFTMEVNVYGTFDLTRLVCQHLSSVPQEGPDNECGIVIMVSSAAAYEGQPGQAAYSASKGAIRSMTLPMARDLGYHGIRVNSIAPGIFESAMTSKLSAKARLSLEKELVFPKRFGEPKEFAECVKWMIESPFVNGECIRLSGGARLSSRL
ncbi:hypothetical protein Clacol_009657 [Clathrus columnatus]|uniref:Uncharacterized protein n=1 Tax=Clathrus columnatus TaxID=1419009 RepID=A0AAV5ASR2_9AGAM|nr:hypothetical protein Clacol_009657 [Clathrus columnatus]